MSSHARSAEKQTVAVSSGTPARSGLVQRKCACGGAAAISEDCDECQKDRLQRKPKEVIQPSAVPSVVHEVLGAAGQPLDPATREFFERRLGHDFSRVRVHTNSEAAKSAAAINALAFTAGEQIVFQLGQYDPKSMQGRRLLAHELTHVAQQSS